LCRIDLKGSWNKLRESFQRPQVEQIRVDFRLIVKEIRNLLTIKMIFNVFFV